MLRATASDGVDVQAIDEGSGPCILIVHGGLGDPAAWAKVAERLRDRFRVVRLHRRRYRLDLELATCAMTEEARDLRALAEVIGQPFVLVGHSSGAVVALEALAAGLPGAVGAVLYEPPALLRDDEFGPAAARSSAALAAGHPQRAIRIFLREFVQMPGVGGWLAGVLVPVIPGLRPFIPGQIGDAVALNDLGARLDAYAGITVPVLMLTGDQSPEHLGTRVHRVADVLPDARVVTMAGQGHGANDRDPDRVAAEISGLAAEVQPSA